MDILKFKEYLLLIDELFEKETVRIEWFKTRLRIKAKQETEKILSEKDLSREEFFEVIEYAAGVLRSLAVGFEKEDKDEEKYILVQQILFNKKIIDEINLRVTSSLATIDEFDTQILTKRSKDNPKEIITHTVSLSFLAKQEAEDDLENIFTTELTKEQLRELVDNLSDSLEQLEQVKEEQKWNQQLARIE